MTDKHPDYNPFVYTANNPIRFIDPDGQDWYEDENCNRRYDEKLTKDNAKDFLKDGQRYLGATFSEKTSDGKGTNNYRKDGSIQFGSQKDGFNYMAWATYKDGNTGGKQKEQYAFIDGNSMLVIPDKLNDALTSKPNESGYTVGDGNYYDPVDMKTKNFDATVHTHDGGNMPSGVTGRPGDFQFQKEKHPSRPGFILGLRTGTIGGYKAPHVWNVGEQHNGFNINSLLHGKKMPLKY